jgi:uncharacterized membrane protein YdjX (TVP38/TMEM64 family)
MRLFKRPRFWFAIAIFTCFLVCLFGPVKVLFDPDILVQQMQRFSCCTIVLFVLVYTLATVLGIPGTLMTVAGGVLFGLVWGTIWSVVGATLGAIGAFWTARYLLRNWAERQFGNHKALVRFHQAIARAPLNFVLAVRFAPISPFNVVNFLFGLTPINWVPYAVGTFVGIIPGTLAYTWLGVTGNQALKGGNFLPFMLALGFLVLLSLMPVWAKRNG